MVVALAECDVAVDLAVIEILRDAGLAGAVEKTTYSCRPVLSSIVQFGITSARTDRCSALPALRPRRGSHRFSIH